MKRKYYISIFVIIIILGVLIKVIMLDKQSMDINDMTKEGGTVNEITSAPKEYLQITGLAYTNGIDTSEGVSSVLYLYDIDNEVVTEVAKIPVKQPSYPIIFADLSTEKIYYSSGEFDDWFDNLFEYDMNDGTTTQLTFGKYTFNDMFKACNKYYLTAMAQYKSVTQPAILDLETNTFTYLNEEDDDTWYHSFSYNFGTDRFTALTCSDAEMRTPRVAGETHIRPKTISLMSDEFKNIEPIYKTEDFEIASVRQLDEKRILMTVDTEMATSDPRKLQLLDIETNSIEDIDIPELREVYSVYPDYESKGCYVLGPGAGENRRFRLLYYNFESKDTVDILDDYEFSSDFKGLVDFIYVVE